jgi:hypothetical protein
VYISEFPGQTPDIVQFLLIVLIEFRHVFSGKGKGLAGTDGKTDLGCGGVYSSTRLMHCLAQETN